jgi:hypothetical protein
MKCFVHLSTDAIGICKSCGKGLCAGCAVDLTKGLACAGRCEKEVAALIAQIAMGRESFKRTNSLARGLGVVGLILGILFVAGIVQDEGKRLNLGALVITVVCLVGGGLLVFRPLYSDRPGQKMISQERASPREL